MNFTAETSFNGISYASGDVLTITMYQLQSLLFQSRSDLTGTKVSSDKPIAVVSGNSANIVVSGGNFDYMVEQLPSVNNWGSEFTIVSFADQTAGYIYKVIAFYDNTIVQIPDQQITLQAGDVYESGVTYLLVTTVESSRPVLVAQFMVSQNLFGMPVGPSMMLINANDQFVSQEVTFSAPSYSHLYATIVISHGDLASLSLDNMPIPTTWSQVDANNSEIVQGELEAGLHVIQSSDLTTRFAVYVYSIGNYISHAFPAALVFGSCLDGTSQLEQ